MYHVLGGCLSPLDGIGPEKLNIHALIDRVKPLSETEVIIALNTSIEGNSTSIYLKEILIPFNIKVSRLAQGIPLGSDLQFVDEFTMGQAIKDRVNF